MWGFFLSWSIIKLLSERKGLQNERRRSACRVDFFKLLKRKWGIHIKSQASVKNMLIGFMNGQKQAKKAAFRNVWEMGILLSQTQKQLLILTNYTAFTSLIFFLVKQMSCSAFFTPLKWWGIGSIIYWCVQIQDQLSAFSQYSFWVRQSAQPWWKRIVLNP